MPEVKTFDRLAYLLLAGILLLFLIGAAIVLMRYYFIQPDSTYLLALGKNIVTGKGLTINEGPHCRYPPAYGFVSGLFYLAMGNLEAAGHLVSVLSGLAAIILVCVYTARAYDRKTALIASLILALNPLFIWISTAAAAEGFYTLIYAAFVLTAIRLLKRPSWWPAFICGLVAGVAYLTRAEGFLLFPLGFVTLLIAWWRGKHGWKPSSIALGLFVVGWLLLAFPYLLFLKENLGGWTLSGKITQNIERVSEAIYIREHGTTGNVPQPGHESPGLIPYLAQNFPRVAERYVGFTYQAVKEAVLRAGPVLLLFLWYIMLALSDGTKRALGFLVFALPLVVYPLAHIENRYLTPALVTIVPVIAWGIRRSWDSWTGDDRYLKLRRWLAIVLVIFLLIGNWLYIRRIPAPPIEHRILAEWMAENLPDAKDARIAASFPYVSFYLGNEDFRRLPKTESVDETMELARQRNFDYLVVDERSTPTERPPLAVLVNPENAPDDLELVIELAPPEVPHKVILYRVL